MSSTRLKAPKENELKETKIPEAKTDTSFKEPQRSNISHLNSNIDRAIVEGGGGGGGEDSGSISRIQD
jgi:hypothetical protein